MTHKHIDRSDDDPSFIRRDATDLINWARRLGISQQEVREAVDGGLIKPAAGSAAADEAGRRERPDAA
jgi:hypothetical protein